jgi:membrane protein
VSAVTLDRLRGLGGSFYRVIRKTVDAYGNDYGAQMAAAISYGVLFSLFPLAILVVAILGLVLQNEQARETVTNWLLDALPLSDQAGLDLENAVSGIASPFSAAGLIALIGLLWGASGMMAAIRRALSNVWNVDRARSAVRGKLFDFLLVAFAGVFLIASFGGTIVVRVVQKASQDAADSLGAFNGLFSFAGEATAILVPLALTFATFVLLYHYVPTPRPPWRALWLPALIAAAAAEIVKNGYAFYLAYFKDYNLVYGSLGAVIGFLFLVYLTATIFLFGAELAATLSTAHDSPATDSVDGSGDSTWEVDDGGG